MSYTIKHIGEGKFIATINDTGEVKEAGPNVCGMIRYTYFEDFTLPPIGWTVTQKQLLMDYQPKVMNDLKEGKIELK